MPSWLAEVGDFPGLSQEEILVGYGKPDTRTKVDLQIAELQNMVRFQSGEINKLRHRVKGLEVDEPCPWEDGTLGCDGEYARMAEDISGNDLHSAFQVYDAGC